MAEAGRRTIAPVHLWLLGVTVGGALLWRLLPPVPPTALFALPLLLLWPNARGGLGLVRLSAAALLLLPVLHGAAVRPPGPAAAADLARASRALLLRPLADPATELAFLSIADEEGPDRGFQLPPAERPLLAGGWYNDGRAWRSLPGKLQLWPHARRAPALPLGEWWLLQPRARAAADGMWTVGRGPIGPFAADPSAWLRAQGRLGRLVLDTAQVELRAAGPLPPAAAGPIPWVAGLRRRCAARLARGTGEAGPWLEAMLLGERSRLPAADVQVWRSTGLAHLLAVSGLHVGVLALALWHLLALVPTGRGGRELLLGSLLLLYAPLAGGQVSVRRAVTMALFLLAGRRLERPQAGLGLLALAAVWILWRHPAELAQPGFQMSFGAVAALMLGMPGKGGEAAREQARPGGREQARPGGRGRRAVHAVRGRVLQALRLTTLAQAGSALAQLGTFAALPLGGVLLNLAAVPLASLFTVAGFLHLLLPLPGEPLGALCAGLARALCHLARAAPTATLAWSPHPGQLALLGLATGLLLLPWGRWRRRLLLAIPLLILAADLLPRLSRPRAACSLFDVGQGDALLLTSPSGRTVLVDAGWEDPRGTGGRGAQLAQAVHRLHDGAIDWLVLTHPDQDHLGGAAGLLRTTEVGAVLWNGEWKVNPPQDRLRRLLDSLGTPLVEARPGQLLQAEPGWRVRVLGPPPAGGGREGNERSIVLRVEAPAGTLLLTGDAGHDEEAWLAAWDAWLEADWLKLGHHGSRGSTSPAFLAAVGAREAWISCGRGNRYGHPHRDVLQRLEQNHIRIHRSDREGWRWLPLDGADRPRRALTRPRLLLAQAERPPP
jgi:competence protein ComEC